MYDVTQLEYSKKVGVPMQQLKYRDYHVLVKSFFNNRRLVINACCLEHLYDVCEKRNLKIVTINTLE